MALFKGEVYSYSLDKMTPLAVYLPADDNKRFLVDKEPKTLVLLHGAEGNYTYWSRYTSVERYAQKNNIALVMPDAELSLYCDMRCGQRYESYIAVELAEILKSLFKIETSREKYYIAGLSMGGYGAMKIALKYPERFGRCASFSGALMLGDEQYLDQMKKWKDKGTPESYDEFYELDKTLYYACKGAFGENFQYDSKNDLKKLILDAENKKNTKYPKILMTCGNEDFLIDVNKQYSSLLTNAGIAHDFHRWSGIHNWDFWEESIRDYMNFFTD